MEQQKKDLPACPVETTLTLIGDKWKVLILRDLLPGTKRFGELKKSIGHVSQKVLTAQLRDMEQSGLVHRRCTQRSRPGGIQPDRPGPEPQAHFRRHAGLGGGVQDREVAGMSLPPLFGAIAPNQHRPLPDLRGEPGSTPIQTRKGRENSRPFLFPLGFRERQGSSPPLFYSPNSSLALAMWSTIFTSKGQRDSQAQHWMQAPALTRRAL